MNCEQLRDHLLQGRVADAPEVRAHAEECNACRELLGVRPLLDALRGGAGPESQQVGDLSRLRQEVGGELAREDGTLARLKSLSTRTRLILALAFVATIGAVEGTLLVRADMPLVPMGYLVPVLALLGVLVVAASWVALRPLFQSALPRWLEVTLLGVCLAVPVGLSFVQPETGHATELGSSGFGRCLVHGLSLALLVWLALRTLDRQSLGGGLGALTAGMAGAVVATLGLQMHCAIPTVSHWLFGHAGVGFVVLVALWIRRKLSDRA